MNGDGVVCLMPCYEVVPPRALLDAVLRHVEAILLVDDGSSEPIATRLRATAQRSRISHVRLTTNSGKGTALRVGQGFLRDRHPPPRAVLALDADGQHPPDSIPAFLAAADSAELVIGDRLGDRQRMPVVRRTTNVVSQALLRRTTRRSVGDTQSGMRLLRGRALEIDIPDGRYEAETIHLKLCLRAGVSVSWIPIPAVYADERSSFRPIRDGLLVLRALALEAPRSSAPPLALRWPDPSPRLARAAGSPVELSDPSVLQRAPATLTRFDESHS